MFLSLILLKLRVLLKSHIVFIQGREEFLKKTILTRVLMKPQQNQRKSRVKGTARKSGLSDQIIEFQNKQRQQICESEIRNQEFIKQLTTQ